MKSTIIITPSQGVLLLLFFSVLFVNNALAQSVGINTSSPAASAALDITATDKGLLVPRMTSAQRTAIGSPATGLLVYDNDLSSFYYYDGTAWTSLATASTPTKIQDADANTKVETEQSSNENYIRFTLDGKEYFKMNKATLEVNSSGKCVYIGHAAGETDNYTFSFLNTNVDGNNTGIGANSLQNVTAQFFGIQNSALGSGSLVNVTTGPNNTGVGYQAGKTIITGSSTTFLGYNADAGTSNLTNATAIGANATVSASNSLVLGYNANVGIGTSAPSEKLEVVGKTKTTSFQMTNGAANGYLLQSDASGNASWVAISEINDGDDLGDHAATQNLQLGANYLSNDGGDEGISIDADGKVTIKTATSTAPALNIATSNTPAYRISQDGTGIYPAYSWEMGGNETLFFLKDVSAGSKLPFRMYAGQNTDRLVLRNNNVGIGVSNPSEALEVSGKTKTTNFQLTNGATNGYVLQSDNTGNTSWVSPTSLANGNWTTIDTNQYSALSGNVGIGTNTPIEKLHIVGNANIQRGRLSFTNTGESVFVGEGAGENDNMGLNQNVFVGHKAGYSNMGGLWNVAIGHEALFSNDGGIGNIALGRSAAHSINGGVYNSIIGYESGYSLTNGSFNTFIGSNVAHSQTSGSQNIVIGNSSLLNNISGSTNIVIGDLALNSISNSANNIAIGHSAGISTTGSNNIFLGNGAGASEVDSHRLYIENSSSSSPLIWGDFENDYLNFNAKVGIGTNTPAEKLHVLGNLRVDGGKLQFTNTGLSLYIGESAGNADPVTDATDQENLAIGKEALYNCTEGFQNIAIGLRSMKNLIEGEGNIAIGADALASGIVGYDNIAIGNEALNADSDGEENVAIGSRSLGEISTGSRNTGVGGDAGTSNQTGSDNIYIGDDCGWKNLGSRNTMIGSNAGYNNLGSDNVLIGYSVGENETGSNKLYIDNSNTASPLIWGDFSSNYLNFNANVGIGTTTPTQAKLVVNGSASNTLSYGYLTSTASIGTCTNCSATYSIYANQRIAASEFNAFSDRRIKKNLRRSDNLADLNTLMALQITDYQMVDNIAKGNKVYKKVIAQEVAEVLPSAVSTMTDVLPDIYQLTDIKAGFVSVKNSGVSPGELVRLIFGEKEELVEVLQADENGFLTKLTEEGPVFVYGRQVNDFHTVDYEALTTLNISATQALVRQVSELKKEKDELRAMLNALSARLEAVETNQLNPQMPPMTVDPNDQ